MTLGVRELLRQQLVIANFTQNVTKPSRGSVTQLVIFDDVSQN